MMPKMKEAKMRPRPLLALCLAASLAGSSAKATGLQPEYVLGVNGLLTMGEVAKVSRLGYGMDIMMNLVRAEGGLGLRAGGGLQLLDGREAAAGQIFTVTGTQQAKLSPDHRIEWLAVGPEWATRIGNSRIDYFVMVGKVTVRATSSGTTYWVAGPDPGITRTSLFLAGAMWSATQGLTELGVEFVSTGSAAMWGDPPAVSDGAGGFVTHGQNARISGVQARVGYHFGRRAGRE